ncbi:MAG: 16S rRNA (adenine(1518)-N(6)/adenine(1519)-N(6))-dimethyltransferase RsmA [Planctomycetota bacterium]|nr:16S rRNA (adenine(1518)-N(6)/adenine(1519)-N(6))-dimethyltransferase RsmA [Planctomycetota bacterium]MDP6764168.1 16S rRNA (adenine(1518)-N(6)/adenine(1519)-N(6))-dimethyltransferase RsmA [Planctomycetota bacterium]MDP6989639.1 16S rRNA (adenine(1518)-N(6)/adenine(1519)-N(6))-dimethyltransferase RsmA [Planctomycetota bacterium]
MSGAGGARRARWSELRAELGAAGFRPSRRLGQNFLLDDNLCRALVRDAGVEPGDFVLEVGCGLGFLTAHLCDAGARVLAVEVDPRLLELARREVGDDVGVRWLGADALAGKHRLGEELAAALPTAGPWRVVANLPYSISAPLLCLLAERELPPTTMSVLLQREVAERIVASPGEPDWGLLSIRLQVLYDARLGRTAAPALFWPRPRVESACVHLALRPAIPDAEQRRELAALAGGLLGRRRQGVGRVLGDLVGSRAAAEEALAAEGIDPRARAETLPLASLAALARSVAWRGKKLR